MTEHTSALLLHGDVMFVDRTTNGNHEYIHLCRDGNGDVVVVVDNRIAVLKVDDVKWLVGNLAAALDDWPVTG